MDEFSSYPPIKRPRKRLPQVIFFLLITLTLGGIGFGVMQFLGIQQDTSTQSVITPSPTPDVFPSDTPFQTPTSVPTAVSSPTPTTIPTVNPVDRATGLDRSDLSVAVQNGSGVVGAASRMSEMLKSFGYHVVSVGNADTFSYENVSIDVKSSVSKYLALLKSDLAKQFTIASSSAALSASASADAVVIVGK